MTAVRRHSNPGSRIRPARPRPSRLRVGLFVVAAMAGLALLGTGVIRGQATATLALDAAGPWRLATSAGPLEISAGPEARLDYRASWLGRGPSVDADLGPDEPPLLAAADTGRPRSVVRIGCETRFPCRASTTVTAPAGMTLEALATGGPVLIDRFSGTAAITTTGEHEVVLGPVDGVLLVDTDRGPVVGTGLAVTDVEVRTTGGPVELGFRERPRSVTVSAGDAPVVILLPPGRYAVTVVGSPTTAIEVDNDETADSRIWIEGQGPVRIANRAEPAETTNAQP